MEEFFIKIWDFLKSETATAILTTVLAGYTIIKPIVTKIIGATAAKKLALVTAKLSATKEQLTEIMTMKNEIATAIGNMESICNALTTNAQAQNAAALLAYDRSNLKEDTKSAIAALLPSTISIAAAKVEAVAESEEVAQTVEAVETAVVETVKTADTFRRIFKV